MKRPCNYPGCSALLDKGTYCEAHKDSAPKRHTLYDRHVRHKDPALAMAAAIRNSQRWRKVRKQVLGSRPLCDDPYGDHARAGVTRSASQVHHIQGLATHPELAFVSSNLQPLCTACHARAEREARSSDKASSQEWRPFGETAT